MDSWVRQTPGNLSLSLSDTPWHLALSLTHLGTSLSLSDTHGHLSPSLWHTRQVFRVPKRFSSPAWLLLLLLFQSVRYTPKRESWSRLCSGVRWPTRAQPTWWWREFLKERALISLPVRVTHNTEHSQPHSVLTSLMLILTHSCYCYCYYCCCCCCCCGTCTYTCLFVCLSVILSVCLSDQPIRVRSWRSVCWGVVRNLQSCFRETSSRREHFKSKSTNCCCSKTRRYVQRGLSVCEKVCS